jgi:hypothetical protein
MSRQRTDIASGQAADAMERNARIAALGWCTAGVGRSVAESFMERSASQGKKAVPPDLESPPHRTPSRLDGLKSTG